MSATAIGVALTLAAATAILPPPPPPPAADADDSATTSGTTSVLGSSVGLKYSVSAPRYRRTGVRAPSFPLTVLSMRVGAGEYRLSYSVDIRTTASGSESMTCRILADGEPVPLPEAGNTVGANGFRHWRQSGSAVLRPSRLTLTCQSEEPWLGTVELREMLFEAEQRL